MPGRKVTPQNRALQDRAAAVLADAWPEMLTSTEVAEKVGGMRTLWEICRKGEVALSGFVITCRADGPRRFPATHHDGPVPQDSWEIPFSSFELNPILNRLAREGLVEKTKVESLRSILWRWSGDSDQADQQIEELESIWTMG